AHVVYPCREYIVHVHAKRTIRRKGTVSRSRRRRTAFTGSLAKNFLAMVSRSARRRRGVHAAHAGAVGEAVEFLFVLGCEGGEPQHHMPIVNRASSLWPPPPFVDDALAANHARPTDAQ
ncbi:unnamed protein product, partial [Ectocarpus sp. 4 AP-2014]